MECSGRHILDNRTEETLNKLKVEEPDHKIYKKILRNWDSIAKPLDGMGRFETITARIGAILGTDEIDISKKAVIVMCADNGIVEEGISQSGQEVTAAVAAQMGKGASSVGKMAVEAGADTIPVDIGINGKEPIEGVINRKIRCGTGNFSKEPAMTREETVRAIFTGIEIVEECKRKGYQILATGEMGIGNTTTSSAVAAALLRCKTDEVTGRGAGLSDEKLQRKMQVITEAVKKYKLYEAEPLTVLETVGGLDIAGLAGVCIGGGVFHIPIVLDGVISMVAALLSERIVQGTIRYLIPSHKGKEPAVEKLMKELKLEPVIDGRMALGEGTGAVMMFSLLNMALCVYNKRTLFSDIKMEQYERYS
ncbi:MAG: nicotinate-nucleotide--dimethylbenzimidazole phosphoribosyltransferase [Lachnospiraceae bacterium]|nr:nicotinate-nucleotide--dimethylbenzimidazole phosphoribosyltransferase [Lachnospiraceae bacterium]